MKIGHLYFSTINLLSIYSVPGTVQGFPGGASGKEPVCNAGNTEDSSLIPGLGRSPGGGQPTPVSLPGESHGQRSLAGYSP